MTIDEREIVWAGIVMDGIATDNEVELVTDIRGYTMEALNDIIFARTGYRSLAQYEEAELGE